MVIKDHRSNNLETLFRNLMIGQTFQYGRVVGIKTGGGEYLDIKEKCIKDIEDNYLITPLKAELHIL